MALYSTRRFHPVSILSEIVTKRCRGPQAGDKKENENGAAVTEEQKERKKRKNMRRKEQRKKVKIWKMKEAEKEAEYEKEFDQMWQLAAKTEDAE